MIELYTVNQNQTYQPAPEIVFSGTVQGIELTYNESLVLGYITFFRHVKHRTPNSIEVSNYFRHGISWATLRLDRLEDKGALSIAPSRVNLKITRLDGHDVDPFVQPIPKPPSPQNPIKGTEVPLSKLTCARSRRSFLYRWANCDDATIVIDDGDPCAIVLSTATAYRAEIPHDRDVPVHEAFSQLWEDPSQFWRDRRAVRLLRHTRVVAVMVNPEYSHLLSIEESAA